MNHETFVESVQRAFPDSNRNAAQGWINFAAECVEAEQYVNFKPEATKEASVEKWLDCIYAGLVLTEKEHGADMANQICGLSTIQSCVYPGEMARTAEKLLAGGNVGQIPEWIENGEIETDLPFLPPMEYQYYITNDALSKGTFPYMGESDRIQESIKPVPYENGTVKGFGVITYPAPLTPEQEKEYCLIPSSQNVNYLTAAEMSVEQNYNQIDGIVNNEQPRTNAGYAIIDSETVGNQEIVLAENPKAVQPFATWRRNISNDEQSGQENFFWGHYFTDPEAAQKDFKARVQEQREDLAESRPSIRSQLKVDAARTDTAKAPSQEHKKDAPER